MNNIELNAILYYADFLSLKDISQPVTDNCKYFFIHGAPVNSLFIIDLQPVYDEENKYIQQAMQEYQLIRNKFGEEGVESFIDDVCCIKACGMVDAERMLRCIHQYSTKNNEKRRSGYTINGKKISYTLIKQSMKKEKMSRQNAQNTYTTMKEVLRDPRYIQATELMTRHEHEWTIRFPNSPQNNENT